MNIQVERINLAQKVLSISKESILEKIKKIIESEMIVAYTVEGKPLTEQQYNKRLKKAEEQIAKGKFTTQEDLEKEIEKW